MLTKEQRKQPITSLEEWKSLIHKERDDKFELMKRNKISEVASYLAEQAVEKTNLTRRSS